MFQRGIKVDIERFVSKLSSAQDTSGSVENPYRNDICRYNLLQYLSHLKDHKIDVMLIGEAPGYRGCALTGIPFTDEAQLKLPENYYALGAWQRPDETGSTSERSASAVWYELRKHHIVPLMWNVYPLHPCRAESIRSNRPPTQAEIKEGLQYVHMLITLFSIRTSRIFAVGKKAAHALPFIDDAHCIRHPSYDFKKEFYAQFDLKIGAQTG